MKNSNTCVERVIPGSIAEEAGICKGDLILKINNEPVRDIFDYLFLTTSDELDIEIQKNDGEIWSIEVEKDEYEDIGIEFNSELIDDEKSCTNKCIFCFIDQLPRDMRQTLYFKDDDTRLSFLTGNYVTLTNISNKELDRVIRYKMSPVNVSVHTTNPELRVFMLQNRFAGDLLRKLKKLVDGGIEVNCQIVLCRGINDGAELEKSVSDLSDLFPGVRSISVVPVGITSHREGLFGLMPYDSESSLAVIEQIKKMQETFLSKHGSRIVFPADEFYIMAGLEMPGFDFYEDFPQIENGVGLIALFQHEFDEYLESIDELVETAESPAGPYTGDKSMPNLEHRNSVNPRFDVNPELDDNTGLDANPGLDVSPELDANLRPGVEPRPREISIATGVSAFRFISDLAGIIQKKFTNIKVHVYEIKNCFFGENVTVTGLLTGGDIVGQLLGNSSAYFQGNKPQNNYPAESVNKPQNNYPADSESQPQNNYPAESASGFGSELLLSRTMFKSGEELLLDGYTKDMLERELNVKVTIVDNNGKDFIEKILSL